MCRLSPPPCRPARKGVGDALAQSRLKPRSPAVAARPRGEGGCRDPRCAAKGGGEPGGGGPAGPGALGCGSGRRGEGRGCLSAVAEPSLAVGRLDGRFPQLPRAPGSLASQGRAFPPPASHCSKFASRWAAELVAVGETGGGGCGGAGIVYIRVWVWA